MFESYESRLGKLPKLNFLGFEMKDADEDEMKDLVRDTDGDIKELN